MTRPVRAQGRPGTEVIPSRWEAEHRPVVEKTMTAAVQIRLPGSTQTWNPSTKRNDLTPIAPYFTGAARIQALTAQARRITTGDDAELVADYLVVVPASVDTAAQGHLVTVVASGDTGLDGRVLLVQQVEYGTERFERDLFCTLTD